MRVHEGRRNRLTVANTDIARAAEKLDRLKTDPRFAIENLYKVWDLELSEMVPFRFNEAQVMLDERVRWFRDRRLPVRLWILKGRRAGISTGCEGYIYHDTTFNSNRISIILANHTKPAMNVFQMCVNFWRSTPPEWRPKLPKKFGDNPPVDRFEFDEINSRLYIATARSLEQYLGSGCSNLHATEVARYPEAEEIFVSLRPALRKAEGSMFFGESTPRGMGNFFHEQVMETIETQDKTRGEYGAFQLLFIEWHRLIKSHSIPFDSMEQRMKFERSLNAEEKDLRRRFPHITLEMLKWRRGMMAGPPFNKVPELFDQEYPTDIETAFLSTGISAFARDDIKRLLMFKRKPLWQGDVYWGTSDSANEIENDYDLVRRPQFLTRGGARASGFKPHSNEGIYENLRVYRWPRPGDRIAIGGDVGGGDPNTKGGDDSTLSVVVQHDIGQHELIMVWQGKINPVDFGILTAALAWAIRYKTGDNPPPLPAIEWTGPGVSTNTYIDNKSLYTPMFRYFNPGVHKQPRSQHIGWESNYRMKKLMVNFLQQVVDKDDLDIPDHATITQMSAFKQFGPAGEEEWGGEGMHDDLVSSLGIACALIRLGRVGSNASDPIDMLRTDSERDGEAFDQDDSGVVSGMDGFGDIDIPPGFEGEDDALEIVDW